MAAQGGEGPADLVRLAADLLEGGEGAGAPLVGLAEDLPEEGMGAGRALARLAPEILGRAADLGAPLAFAHMDPPTLPVAQAVTWWNAVLNQNLLHPDTSPAARAAEARAVAWLAPYFGMDGGHMLPGSTLANLTALWAARDLRGVRRVVASGSAHLSVAKAAHILGLEFEAVATDAADRLDVAAAGRLTDACLVLTAGTTSSGAIDPLGIAVRRRTHAAWVHVDAAWAGPLRLSRRHGAALDGIEDADSVAVSAHKWLFQPKESALVLFRETAAAHGALSFGGAYLAVPNIGVLGSHGAAGAALLASLMAHGRAGIAARIDRAMALAETLAEALTGIDGVTVFAPPVTGVVLWRLEDPDVTDAVWRRLPAGMCSRGRAAGESWIRQVAANPAADIPAVVAAIRSGIADERLTRSQEPDRRPS